MDTRTLLSPQAVSLSVLQSKYLRPGERTQSDVFDRVAKALAQAEAPARRAHFEAVFRHQLGAGVIGAGRIMAGAGSGLPVTLANCFVQPVGDCLRGHDAAGYPGIRDALAQAAQTLRRGGGVGYDFSRIRPQGARVNGSGSGAIGPCRFIDEFDLLCASVQSLGARRSAQMAVLRCDHPDVLDFINAKKTPGRWSCFNVSVGISDAFMHAVAQGQMWDLVHAVSPRLGQALAPAGPYRRGDGLWVYQSLPARQLWTALTRAAYQAAEPGVLFLDTIERDNNLRAIETVEATNPCGEQPLPAYGCCVLGPLILPNFVRHAFQTHAELDMAALAQGVRGQVRALDNVLEIGAWPLPEQAQEARSKRRIGIGFTGLADALVMLGLRYDSAPGRAMAGRIAQTFRDNAYAASVALAKERGPYPLFDADVCLAPGTFASRLPPALRAAIRKHGMRHSHLLSIASTGSVSLAFADNVSTGIEPVFEWVCTRRLHAADGSLQTLEVEDHAWRVFKAMGGDARHLPAAFACGIRDGFADPSRGPHRHGGRCATLGGWWHFQDGACAR